MFTFPLFRSSRPDYIETFRPQAEPYTAHIDCSGLLGRTTLRLEALAVLIPNQCSIVPVF